MKTLGRKEVALHKKIRHEEVGEVEGKQRGKEKNLLGEKVAKVIHGVSKKKTSSENHK